MKPYYEQDGITIYHGDCREVLPTLEPVDFVVTDPPYIGLKGGTIHLKLGGVAAKIVDSESIGDPWEASLSWTTAAWDLCRLGVAVFCSYHSVQETAQCFPPTSRVALLTWYKRNSPVAVANVPRFTTEFCWLFKKSPGLKWRNIKDTMIDIPLPSAGCMATERICVNSKAVHPTQKPLALMSRILAVGGESILDCFSGTGTTLVAAKALGQRAVGIEINESYCELAANRLAQGVLFSNQPQH